MELRRYRKNHRLKPESVDSSVFVAIWADCKFVHGLDEEGVEWMLCGGYTLKEIETGTTEFTRVHRGVLVAVAAVDRLMSTTPPDQVAPKHYCTVRGREFPVSRRFKPSLHRKYRAHVAQRGFTTPAVAA